MKLYSITARNYRLHRDITVDFDRSRNLIGGPNETGKSTLAEAIHRGLFLRAKTGGKVQHTMRSDQAGAGHPEVSLTFEVGDQVWTVDKKFSGPSGTIRLAAVGGSVLHGEDAETKLAMLLQNTDGASTTLKQLETQWAHLWVWQGTSGDKAAVHAGQQKDRLVQRLQSDGLAAVMQSDFDQLVREKIRAAHDEIFTNTAGRAKAGSKLESAAKAVAAAAVDLGRASDFTKRLVAAVEDQTRAAGILAYAAAELPGLRDQLANILGSLARVTELRSREEREASQYQNACQAREQLVKLDDQISDLRKQAAAAKETLLPAEAKLALLADQDNAARDSSSLAEATHRKIGEEVRGAGLLNELASACIGHFEKSASCEALTSKTKDVADIRESLAAATTALAQLPVIGSKDLESLRKLDGQFRQAESALAALAAGVELISAEQPIELDGKPLAAGESRVITEVAELTLGDGTRLRIHPGGGTSLAQTRLQVTDASQKLTGMLDRLTVPSLEDAAGIVAQRQVLDSQISTIEARLEALGAKELPAALATATTDRDSSAAEVGRRRNALPVDLTVTLPDSVESARLWQTHTAGILDEAVRTENTARRDMDSRRKTYQQVARNHTSHREAIETARQTLGNLDASATALETNQGDAATRASGLVRALENETNAKDALATTQTTLTELNPEALASSQANFDRRIKIQEQNQREAETALAVAKNVLALDGSHDPMADLTNAKARLATLQEEHAREERRANAIVLLQRLFSESQSAIIEKVTQPIAERISGYLACVLGAGVRARLEFGDDGTQSLELIRPGGVSFGFDTLSGGTREQVAAAVRLAMAEILAADHGGCLPLVFDDAFAYADPERVESLQRMLDLAATRGLQVIVLTCTPRDYIALGAREIRFYPPQVTVMAATALPSAGLKDTITLESI